MIQQLSWSITNIFIDNKTIPNEDGEIYAFGFECMLATAIQIMVLLIAGLLFKCLTQLAIFTLAFTQIKKHIGGWHADTHFTCISGFTLASIVMVFSCSFIPIWGSIIFMLIALFLIYKFAPIQHTNNPKTKDEILQGRKIAIITTIIEIIIICVLLISPFAQYALYGAGGLFLASLSLIIPNKK